MLREFIKLNRLLVLTTLKFLIILFFAIPLIINIILIISGSITKPTESLINVVGFCLGLIVFITSIMLLKGTYDLRITRRNFNSNPFNELEKIGFHKIIINQNSKSNFAKELYRGEINGFIIDIDTDTHNESQYLRFRFSLKPIEKESDGIKFNNRDFNYPNIESSFSEILRKYHFNSNELKSIDQLEKELTEITTNLKKKRLE